MVLHLQVQDEKDRVYRKKTQDLINDHSNYVRCAKPLTFSISFNPCTRYEVSSKIIPLKQRSKPLDSKK
jgi:hypothetical protein